MNARDYYHYYLKECCERGREVSWWENHKFAAWENKINAYLWQRK
jgi:hypothetical protein